MVEYNSAENINNTNKYNQGILPQAYDLPINQLAGLFKNVNQSYKFFWFQAIVNVICDGRTEVSYDELINKMMARAWFMVMEYHLNLGPSDALEIAINQVRDSSHLKANEKENIIISYLQKTDDRNIRFAKQKLVKNVPYRLQAPFLNNIKGKEWESFEIIASKAIESKNVLYYYEKINKGNNKIVINERWIDYIKQNRAIIDGWVQNQLILYLQKRNPNVPGIPFKLDPPKSRKLKEATKFWKAVVDFTEIKDIYTERIISAENLEQYGRMAIDHFVPWSYVANDEMWNLTPTFSSVNSSKSNLLPNDRKIIDRLSYQHYTALEIADSNKEIKKLLNNFKKQNLNSSDIARRLYDKNVDEHIFKDEMNKIILPIMNSASNAGFGDWVI